MKDLDLICKGTLLLLEVDAMIIDVEDEDQTNDKDSDPNEVETGYFIDEARITAALAMFDQVREEEEPEEEIEPTQDQCKEEGFLLNLDTEPPATTQP
jgi:hypothetical protein